MKVREANLHVPDQEREENQSGDRDEDSETVLPNVCTCFKVLPERTGSRNTHKQRFKNLLLSSLCMILRNRIIT